MDETVGLLDLDPFVIDLVTIVCKFNIGSIM